MADLRAKALAYVREGRVVITTATTMPEQARPVLVVATVHGHRRRYRIVRWACGTWSCTCLDAQICPHIAATALVTGSPHLAGRPDPIPERTTS